MRGVKNLKKEKMKVIISRKGFDSKYGGCPSPIFADGSMVSLPIPSSKGPTTYSEISANGRNLGSLVDSLTGGRLTGSARAHFDPDLDSKAMKRLPGWLPAFGQVGGPRTHLDNCGVGIGDLFLFFGWYRYVDVDAQGIARVSDNSKNIHAIFGYLQVGEILNVGSDAAAAVASKPWLASHPHVVGTWGEKNRIYVASEQLTFPSLSTVPRLPGGGVFRSIAESRILTHPGQGNRSLWCLPEAFAPTREIASLSCHHNLDRWRPSVMPGRVTLQSVSQGQEFVLQVNDAEILNKWISEVFFGI